VAFLVLWLLIPARYSLVGSAKLNGLDPELYLRTVLGQGRRSSHRPYRGTPAMEPRRLTQDPLLSSCV